MTVLHSWAASFGSLPVVQVLLQANARCDIQNSQGVTALHEAAKGGHPEMVAALMHAGADPSVQGTAGCVCRAAVPACSLIAECVPVAGKTSWRATSQEMRL